MFYPPGLILADHFHKPLRNVCIPCPFVYYFRMDFENVNMYFDFLNTNFDFLNHPWRANQNGGRSTPFDAGSADAPVLQWAGSP